MFMRARVRAIPIAILLALAPLHLSAVLAQTQMPMAIMNNGPGGESVVATVDLDIRLTGLDGKPVRGAAVVTLTKSRPPNTTSRS